MNNYKHIELAKTIDWGDIDGLYDPNINSYFIDIEYKHSLLNTNKCFVVGRKGTGKSALYHWLETNQNDYNIMVENLSFNDFPFEKLLYLSDNDFSKPNQYQSIWKNIIYTEIARLIISDQTNISDESWLELAAYIKYVFGKNVVDLHKEVTRLSTKTSTCIGYDNSYISSSNGLETDLYDNFHNITKINERLWLVINSYVKRNPTKQYIIQFDQLDDNYTTYINRGEYLQCLISLFKSIYQINQSFKKDRIPIKIIAYIRSDIYNQFNSHDPESSRWEQYVLKLNWAIINKTDWHNCNLLKMLNARIVNSHPELKDITKSPFHSIFNKYEIDLKYMKCKSPEDIFKYIIHRTLQRPRDVLQFCIKIQEEILKTNRLDFTTIKNAEKEYSLWLLSELENEITPMIGDIKALYEMLRLFGRTPYTLDKFRKTYASYASKFPNIKSADELLEILYGFGVIINVRLENKKIVEQFSTIRNDRSVFNRDLNIITHSGFYEGLHTSKFLSR